MNKLIKLRPLDYYFFGGEETFDNGAKGLKNFHVKSNLLPQQTGLAGLIRHQLVLAGYGIGAASFNGASVPQWESLKSISPLFLCNNENQFLVRCPAVIKAVMNDAFTPVQMSFESSGYSFRNGKWQNNTIQVNGYDAKKGLTNCWLNLETKETISENKIFETKNHIGINKAKRMEQQDDTGAFYQQEYISLVKGYSFCAFVEFSDDVVTDKLNTIMPFGGEKRSFDITYLPAETNWEQIKTQAVSAIRDLIPQQLSIILLSDTYVENLPAFYNSINGGIFHAKPFRNITTPGNVRSVNFARLTNKEGQTDQLRKSDRMLKFLEKGAVIFPNDLGACVKLLSNPVYSSIGYNQFIIINQP
jgi:CRISPR-associated protein Cmr3